MMVTIFRLYLPPVGKFSNVKIKMLGFFIYQVIVYGLKYNIKMFGYLADHPASLIRI